MDKWTYPKITLEQFLCHSGDTDSPPVFLERGLLIPPGTGFQFGPLKRHGEYTLVRLDMHEMDVDGKTLRYPHLQFDHGLEFAELFKRIATVELTRKIMDGLYDTVQTLGKSMPDSFMYITPTAAAD